MPLARATAIVAAVIAGLTVSGWLFAITALKSWYASDAFTGGAAVAAVLVSIAAFTATRIPLPRKWIDRLVILAILAIVIQIAIQLFQLAPAAEGWFIHLTTSLAITLSGVALFMMSRTPNRAYAWAVSALLLSLIAVLQRLFNVPLATNVWEHTTAPFPVAVLSLTVSVTALSLRSSVEVRDAFTGGGAARILVRQFLPLAIVAFLSLHWLGRLGFQYGLYSAGLQSVIVTVAGLAVIVALTLLAIRQIHTVESERTLAIHRFEAAVIAAGASIYEWQPRRHHVRWITGLEELTGFTPEEAEPSERWWASLLHPDDYDQYQLLLSRTGRIGDIREGEYRIRHKSGEYIFVQDRFVIRKTENGDLTLAIGSMVDVSGRRRREDALRASNEDLRQFAYAVSHDLQEPLRMIAIFTQLMERSFKNQLPQGSRPWMDRVVEGAQRMSELLRDLRSYIEVAQQDWTLGEAVDANESLKAALANLSLAIAETGTHITHGPLPKVRCPPVFLTLVFQNLIENAIKYRGASPPEISIEAEETGNEYVISVKDNGIGIDSAHFSTIFGIFRRLSNKMPGTGIGLAICAKVIDRCGGRLWVESQLGEGSIFSFSFPRFHRIATQ